MEYVTCKNCFGQVEIPDNALEVICPHCGSPVKALPRQEWEQEEKDRERIRRIAEAAAAEERLRIAREREVREAEENNLKIRKTYLIAVAALIGVAMLSVLVSTVVTGALANIGAAIGALLVEAVAFSVPFLLSLWAINARIKNKGGRKAALVLTRIFAGLGIALWAAITTGSLMSDSVEGMMILWTVSNVALNLLAFIMPGKVKIQEKK